MRGACRLARGCTFLERSMDIKFIRGQGTPTARRWNWSAAAPQTARRWESGRPVPGAWQGTLVLELVGKLPLKAHEVGWES